MKKLLKKIAIKKATDYSNKLERTLRKKIKTAAKKRQLKLNDPILHQR